MVIDPDKMDHKKWYTFTLAGGQVSLCFLMEIVRGILDGDYRVLTL